jgi:hypothetical protein
VTGTILRIADGLCQYLKQLSLCLWWFPLCRCLPPLSHEVLARSSRDLVDREVHIYNKNTSAHARSQRMFAKIPPPGPRKRPIAIVNAA